MGISGGHCQGHWALPLRYFQTPLVFQNRAIDHEEVASAPFNLGWPWDYFHQQNTEVTGLPGTDHRR